MSFTPTEMDDILTFDTVSILERGKNLVILYHHVTTDGTVATVYEVDGTRRYRAMEFTHDSDEEGSWSPAYGYDTSEKHHYMGERYRGLFGDYESEVYYRVI